MNNKVIAFVLVCLSFLSCKKQPGEGGFASIEGKVYVKNYDASFTLLTSEYYLPAETVYIIYGDDISYGDRIKTGPDGRFEFKYLREGKYQIYVLGKDASQPYLSIPKQTLVEVNITERKQKKILNDLVIIK